MQLFNVCFGLGVKYYATSNAAMFLPGILMLLVQGRFDHIFDRKYGTLRCNAARLVGTTSRLPFSHGCCARLIGAMQ